jgi:hypothetical protein
MSAARKIGTGVAAFAPLLLTLGCNIAFVYFVATTPGKAPAPTALAYGGLGIFGVFACSSISVGILFAVGAWRSDRVADDVKPAWATVLALCGMIAAPVFWWIHIWREPRPRAPMGPLSRRGRMALGIGSFAPAVYMAACFSAVPLGFLLIAFVAGPDSSPAAAKPLPLRTPQSETNSETSPAETSAPETSPAEESGTALSAATTRLRPGSAIALAAAAFLALGFCFALLIASIAAKIVHIVRVFRMDTFAKNDKVLWLLFLIFASFAAMPILWHLHVRIPKPPKTPEPNDHVERKRE